MPIVKLGDLDIFYDRKGSGPPVVAVHGSWGDHRNWDPVAEAFAREFDLVRYDRRGHSKSGPASVPGTTDHDVDDLLGLIDRLSLDRPAIVGNSFGAIVTLKAVARAPDAFRAIVIHEPPLMGMIAEDPAFREQLAQSGAHFEAIVSLLLAGKIEEGTRTFVETIAFGPGAWSSLPEELKNTFMTNAMTWVDELRDPTWSMLDPNALSRFDRPALLTDATDSAPFFRPIVEKLAPILPRVRRVTFQGTGHVPHATHPDVYLPVVLGFLREVSG
jgi:pimeloyl-ACP methyl ester carboxylesterase